ncbi:DUF932 domain-containing protein [Nocardia transvalensis]|uniref:DUF932 domain-containing protein n=1 Tax=Nocardia transvalensis TaxID=37333 RepID=UPI00189311C9|nr:DUF932 domain-containing protein [Nocardia transvalensis]MBF6333664.1 DUF945 domain-containing protein [Nocardia transvalensis]
MVVSPPLIKVPRRDKHTVVRVDRPLTDEEIRTVAPSVFATEKYRDRSDRYTYLSTADVLAALREEGFEPYMAAQARTRDADRVEYTRHMLRFRHIDVLGSDTEEPNEIGVLNAHDGGGSFRTVAARFRKRCRNGLVVGSIIDDIRIPHLGDVANRVVDAAQTIVSNFDLVDESRNAMDAVVLSEDERIAFAQAALGLKWDDPEHPAPIDAKLLLRPRNYEERPATLWSTYNIVQANLIGGGLLTRNVTRNGRHTRTRPVRGIGEGLRLNRDLWDLAQERLTN